MENITDLLKFFSKGIKIFSASNYYWAEGMWAGSTSLLSVNTSTIR